jgi:hypothetical protein
MKLKNLLQELQDDFYYTINNSFESLLFYIPRKYILQQLKHKNLYNIVIDFYTELLARK